MKRLTAAELGVELSYQLDALPDRATYLDAACTSLHEAIGADVVGWIDVDVASRSAEICSDPPAADTERRLQRRLLAEYFSEVPTVRYYGLHPTSFEPKRVSDLVTDRTWRSHRIYCEFFRPMGLTHQMAVVLPPRTVGRGTGWYFNGAGDDFTDTQVSTARALQPMLAVLNRAYTAIPAVDTDRAREQAGVTSREQDILTLLAQGLTASQIATLRRISVRTVNKHLEHLYRKLGCNDRLQAVNKSRQLGLIT
jgi:DNA-binding CsgD family transcriptional regulator